MSNPETIRSTGAAYTRSPNGCNQQVMTQITPEERERLNSIAGDEMRSVSGTLRMLMLRGMQAYQDETLGAN